MAQQWGGGFGKHRVNRRRVLAAIGAGAAATAMACNANKGSAPSASKPASQAVKQPKKGGVVNYAGGVWGSFDIQGRTFDPHIQTQSGAPSTPSCTTACSPITSSNGPFSRHSRRSGNNRHRLSTFSTSRRTSSGRTSRYLTAAS